MDFSDIVILCITPNSCCQQNLMCFDMPLYFYTFRILRFTFMQYLFAIIISLQIGFSTVAVAQWVRRWSSGHRIVQVEGLGPSGEIYKIFFQQ